MTLTTRLQKCGVAINTDFDTSIENSLKDARSLFWLPIWERKWAYDLMVVEPSEGLTKERYLKATRIYAWLGYMMCCCWCCCKAGNSASSVHPKGEHYEDVTSSSKGEEDGEDFYLTPLYTLTILLHYLCHLCLRVPMYYVQILIMCFNSVVFRIGRSGYIFLIKSCCCWGKFSVCGVKSLEPLKIICSFFINAMLTAILIPCTCLNFWMGVFADKLIFIPILSLTVFVKAVYENVVVEPFVYERKSFMKIGNILERWAWGADQLKNDPGGIEADSQTRISLMHIDTTLRSFSAVLTNTEVIGYAESLLPFFVETMLLYIVYIYQDLDFKYEDSRDGQIRFASAIAASIYYTVKAAESTKKFTQIAKGHVTNLTLFVDFLTNVVYAYIIIPLACAVVLTSEEIDIVLNLLALEFVTIIDEELFENTAKERYRGPYCVVVKVRQQPLRLFGLCSDEEIMCKQTDDLAPVDPWSFVFDVYERNDIKYESAIGGKKETEDRSYWIKNSDLCSTSFQITPSDDLRKAKTLFKNYWGLSACYEEEQKTTLRSMMHGLMQKGNQWIQMQSKNRFKNQQPEPEQKSKVEEKKLDGSTSGNRNLFQQKKTREGDYYNSPHLELSGIPETMTSVDIEKKVLDVLDFYLEELKISELGGRSTWKYQRNGRHQKLSVFFPQAQVMKRRAPSNSVDGKEGPMTTSACDPVLRAYFKLDAKIDSTFQIAEYKMKKCIPVKINPVIPSNTDENNIFQPLQNIYTEYFRDLFPFGDEKELKEFVESHVVLKGEYDPDHGGDSRILTIFDLPFVDQKKESWLFREQDIKKQSQ